MKGNEMALTSTPKHVSILSPQSHSRIQMARYPTPPCPSPPFTLTHLSSILFLPLLTSRIIGFNFKILNCLVTRYNTYRYAPMDTPRVRTHLKPLRPDPSPQC
ncbi:hypothetical protein BO86DRAFT_180508 [Aspergillus japonicus CBS 114.51]|uniref:Uncharacterized protein n=2 Tax=Aspergillus TaxID=5052 RepID=A0A2V5IJC7_ASPV1|nr:hypothetical protein BO86DRAFT_180508 [Aspergillus japonicus CBS 114.51]PYI19856.1 hypothetical protein BO99DRAFT_131110 [Aspergillus violaceofuscus CBS 115571]RAH78498.1 hypothetical protein BO86DRAFT_180508 [Aspergillus japonicus CBS 114.51]